MYSSQVAHVAGVYGGPYSRSLSRFPALHEATRKVITPPWMGCQSITRLQGNSPTFHPASLQDNSMIYNQKNSWVDRSIVRVKCFASEHNTVIPQGCKPGLSNLESTALTSEVNMFNWSSKITWNITTADLKTLLTVLWKQLTRTAIKHHLNLDKVINTYK